MQVKNANVEAIYPLNFLQQALLFHSLQDGVDQGFLQVKCMLKGKINLEAFQTAWRQNIQRHESLRTSVHWQNLEKPVQVVHKEVLLPFIFDDWSENSERQQKTRLEKLLRSDAGEALDLNKAPVLRIFLIKLSADKHFLLWDCHHILADGWSGSIILQDLLAFYGANCSAINEPALPVIPSYKSYLNWLKRQDHTKAKSFWIEVLNGFRKPTLIGNHKQSQRNLKKSFLTQSLILSEEESQKLRGFSQKNKITLNTLIQGIWAILLSSYVEQDDIAFGTVVSGRSIDLPHAELMAGMFMNVLPLRIRVNGNEKFSHWLKSLQSQQAKTRDFEYFNLDDILNSSSGAANGNLMFDTLVVFENIPLENIHGGGISFESFESGLTTNYTMTLSAIPHKEIKVYLKYDSYLIPGQQANWFLRNLSNLCAVIIENKSGSLNEIKNLIAPLGIKTTPATHEDSTNASARSYLAPRNEAELVLVGIWENMLNIKPVGINDDFFDLGGTSITALRLFAEIEKQFQKKIQPISLLSHRTVEALAKFIAEGKGQAKFSSLVPLRASGSKAPIFCLHAGGGHVFFYKDLAKHLGTDQPVYALQRLDVDDVTQPAQDIESTASYYLEEIRRIQPNGSFSLLAYCFSITVCWEMVRQLKEAGSSILLIAIIDSQPPFEAEKLKKRTTIERINGILNKARALDFSFIKNIWIGRIKRPIKAKWISLISDRETISFQKKMEKFNLFYATYNWQPLPVKITFIRSAEYSLNHLKNERASQWNKLSLNGVDTYVVDGQHKDLFNEPEVKQLADQLSQCLEKAYNDVAKSTR